MLKSINNNDRRKEKYYLFLGYRFDAGRIIPAWHRPGNQVAWLSMQPEG
jgi:hypothetical protein